MKLNGVIAILVALCLAVQCMGCSWVLMDRAPEDYKTYYEIQCSGKQAPVTDAVVSGLYTILGATYLFNSFYPAGDCGLDNLHPYCLNSEESIIVSVFLGVWAIVHGFSSWTGFCWAEECEDAKNKHALWIQSLTPRQKAAFNKLVLDLERKNQAETCRKIVSTMRSFPSKNWWTRYVSECNGTWKEYAQKVKGTGYRWVKTLFIYKLSANTVDLEGRTLLHYAASIGSSKLTKYLVKKNADPKIKDKEGKTPLDIAVEKGHEGVVELLRNAAGGGK